MWAFIFWTVWTAWTPPRRIMAALDAEAAQMDSVRALLPRFEAKIQRVLDRVWGNGGAA